MLIFGGLWLVLIYLIANPALPGEIRLSLFTQVALMFLLAGISGVFAVWGNFFAANRDFWVTLLLAFSCLFPILCFLLPIGTPAKALHPGSPNLFLSQVLTLGGSLWILFFLSARFESLNRLLHLNWQELTPFYDHPNTASTWIAAVLDSLPVGMGLWLVFIFLSDIFPLGKPFSAPTVYEPVPGFILFGGLLVAPWVEGIFYRQFLLLRWKAQIGEFTSIILSASVCALIQGRPFSWGIFFCIFYLLTLSARRFGLLTSILAQVIFNVLALFFTPSYLL